VKRLLVASFGLILLFGACSADQPLPEAAASSPTAKSVALDSAPSTATPFHTVVPLSTPAPSTPLPTVGPVDEPVAIDEPATLTPPPSPTREPDPPQVISGQTAEGAFFLGDPQAPVTVIDYSDFL